MNLNGNDLCALDQAITINEITKGSKRDRDSWVVCKERMTPRGSIVGWGWGRSDSRQFDPR